MFPTPFNSSLLITTDVDSEYLFVLEPAQSRVVILTKEGEFFKEVASPTLASATGIAFSSSNNLVLVASGSQVFSIGL